MPRPANIVVLTGAGLSAESGIATFRDSGGLWEQHRIEDVATPEGFARDPELVHRFYNERRANAAAAEPNAAHQALARLANHVDLVLITQNVDDLHERGGSANAIHMHGALNGALCAACGHRWPAPAVMAVTDSGPACAKPATRPDIVWFGEIPMGMEEIFTALERCDDFVAIGTSGNVYPAAGFVQVARAAGAHTVELNLEPSFVNTEFEETRLGPAGTIVPEWVEEMLKG